MPKPKNNRVWIALVATLLTCAWLYMTDAGEGENDGDLLPKTNHQALNNAAFSHQASRNQTNRQVGSLAIELVESPSEPNSPSTTEQLFRKPITDTPKNLFNSAFVSPVNPVANNVAVLTPLVCPFSYVGQLSADAQTTIFITDGTRNLAVNINDTIDGIWQVTAIKPPFITLTNIPQKIDFQLEIGA